MKTKRAVKEKDVHWKLIPSVDQTDLSMKIHVYLVSFITYLHLSKCVHRLKQTQLAFDKFYGENFASILDFLREG